MTVGERIKELRTQLGLSQVEFAEKINTFIYIFLFPATNRAKIKRAY